MIELHFLQLGTIIVVSFWLGTVIGQNFPWRQRPETLFGTKFESYLNSRPEVKVNKKSIPHRDNFIQRDYDDSFFDQISGFRNY